MAGKKTVKGKIVRDTVRRFHHLPDRTIARHLINNYPDLFLNEEGKADIEKARTSVRYYTGKIGDLSRKNCKDKDLHKGAPSKLPTTWIQAKEPYNLPPGSWLVLCDIHVPFHEVKPLETAIAWGLASGVDGVFLNGDIQDCHSVSFWPTAKRDFDKELESTLDFLDFLRHEFRGKQIVYKPGNHEYRLPRRFADKMPELATSPLSAMETYMGFEERKIEFLGFHQKVMAGELPIIHGHEVPAIHKAVNAARGLFLRAKSWAMCGHCHSTSEHTSVDISGKMLTTWSVGCLCDLSPEYMPMGNDWNWGAAIVHCDKSGGFEVENKRILPSGKLR
jgi:predicted phosphodiesterase